MKYNWYSKFVPLKLWNDFYSLTGGYSFLEENKQTKEVRIGFLAVIQPEACLEISDIDDLMKIQKHREANNHYPQPFENIKKN
ncbi:MAG: hypothetical protein WC223_13190 [Bacteroidales bacterium]|jgi:hypothetical protein